MAEGHLREHGHSVEGAGDINLTPFDATSLFSQGHARVELSALVKRAYTDTRFKLLTIGFDTSKRVFYAKGCHSQRGRKKP